MPRKDVRGWYAARALFRLIAVGKPRWTDRYFDPNSTLVEDRIVLFQAKDFDDAIRQAEAEAERYSRTTCFKNIYGQRVHLKFLRATDVFHAIIEGQPHNGSEVYSKMAMVPKSIRDSQIVTNWWGKQERRPWQTRNKFVDGQILLEALTAINETKRRLPRAKQK